MRSFESLVFYFFVLSSLIVINPCLTSLYRSNAQAAPDRSKHSQEDETQDIPELQDGSQVTAPPRVIAQRVPSFKELDTNMPYLLPFTYEGGIDLRPLISSLSPVSQVSEEDTHWDPKSLLAEMIFKMNENKEATMGNYGTLAPSPASPDRCSPSRKCMRDGGNTSVEPLVDGVKRYSGKLAGQDASSEHDTTDDAFRHRMNPARALDFRGNRDSEKREGGQGEETSLLLGSRQLT
ncbi:hypothetical protein AXG93_1962s1550 [Marchantia polymorpha subsp. ruderalis]|uniref:Uncharacterized protein n=1 Tax=Marchantia polymorpha subsp. ruderalis TaxID=1480154 RepID=A0A176WDI3_MARPO|nr:hypothetical protein AXG93_1962s1550 [Marchantia polymorpha subsp. ruderalis]